MSAAPLPLNIIVDVTVITSSPQVAAPTFNMGLVIGTSAVIPPYGANSRIRTYNQATWQNQMITDGFTSNDPEYIAVQLYFSQQPPPQKVQVGVQVATAIQTAIPHASAGGTGYVVGDIVGVTQGGASNGFLRVSAVTSGAVTALQKIVGQQGFGYAIATALSTTGGTGTGLEVDITAIGETCLDAATVCRIASPQWYPFMCTAAAAADHIALATWAQSQIGTIYMGTDSEAGVLNGTPNNTFDQIYALGSSRTWMQYATTQSSLYPNQAYFVAAVMGQMMASNTQLQNSAFTEKFSGGVPLVGVVTEPLTQAQISNIEGSTPGQGPNGNLFLNYAGAFNVLEQGTMMAEDVFFDQVLNLDVLAANIQFNVMNLLTSVPKIPQNNAGQQLLIQAVEQACAQAALTGFISQGVWEGQTILKLTPGKALPLGYLVQSPDYSTVSQADIVARKAPPIYVALIEAGAVHFVTVAVLVQV